MARRICRGRRRCRDQLARRRGRGRGEVADGCAAHGRRALTGQADVGAARRRRERWSRPVERGLGPIDVLVNNAGVFPRVAFLEMPESDWDYVLDVNLKGACFCAQAAARAMVAAGRQGVDHQPDLGRGLSRFAARGALLREQGRRRCR